MTEKNFYKFAERNEWEGETWNFYILITKEERSKLKKLIGKYDWMTSYSVSDDTITEDVINELVRNQSDYGYMAKHNKIINIKPIPDEIDIDKEGDIFYKGKFWK